MSWQSRPELDALLHQRGYDRWLVDDRLYGSVTIWVPPRDFYDALSNIALGGPMITVVHIHALPWWRCRFRRRQWIQA